MCELEDNGIVQHGRTVSDYKYKNGTTTWRDTILATYNDISPLCAPCTMSYVRLDFSFRKTGVKMVQELYGGLCSCVLEDITVVFINADTMHYLWM